MDPWVRSITIVGALAFAGSAFALQAPADAPAGTTGLCKDGTYYSGASKKGACHGHKGVKDWYGAAEAAPAAGAATPAPAAAPAPAAKAAAPAAPAKTAAPGGGPGLVWVNTSSKVYHCPNDKWYGKTKAGEYMSEADAKAKGYRAERGKACE
jgi:hypothetical protein